MNEKYDYDAIIIGAGISGLVCGCYLAKAGLKTLIVEKNAKPGGYCTSFMRNGYFFDACAHGLGSLRADGRLTRILADLNIVNELQIVRHEPSLIIDASEYRIKVQNNINANIDEFSKHFFSQKKQIEVFFRFITSGNISSFSVFRKMTLQQLLDDRFSDSKLKAILSILVFGFIGLPPWRVSSVVACLILREFIFDGGYYPIKGMQSFADALLNSFKNFGGNAIFSNMVKTIILNENKVAGITLRDGQRILSKCVVSACDITHTFSELIKNNDTAKMFAKRLNKLTPSSSCFICYLGINKYYDASLDLETPIAVINNYDLEKSYSNMFNYKNDFLLINASRIGNEQNPQKVSIRMIVNTIYKGKEFWVEERANELFLYLLKQVDRLMPNLAKSIDSKFLATPLTLSRWTGNYQGAAYGWESTIDHFGDPDLSQKTLIDNLYVTGHWTNQSSGLTLVANCGFDTADMILRRKNMK